MILRALSLSVVLSCVGVSACASMELANTDEAGGWAINECSSDSSCAGGRCQEGLCVATETPFERLLFEVTPPAGVSDPSGTTIAGVRFVQEVERASWEGGWLDLELGYVARIRGAILGGEFEGSCVPAPEGEAPQAVSEDDSLPARVTLVPRARLLGLPNPLLTTQAIWQEGAYRFALDVPPGSYDIYVEPSASDHGCVRSPYLIVDREIPAANVDLNVTLPEPRRLAVNVRWPFETDELTGWTIDIVERGAGRLVSNRVVLGSPQETEGGLMYQATLAFSGVSGDGDLQVDEIVRLSPPADSVAPTVYVQRSVVELFQGGAGLIDQLAELPEPVRLSGRVNHAGSPKPAPATVSVIATTLSAVSPGTIAAFSRTVSTDADGTFQVALLPGEYRVLIVPAEAGRATSEQKLTVSSLQSEQKGLVFEVPAQSSLSGDLVDFNGRPIEAGLVQAAAMPRSQGQTIADIENGLGSFVARTAAASTNGDGAFELSLDPGRYDVIAQPQESSGVPWSVRLGLEVDGPVGVQPLVSSLPGVVSGHLESRDVGRVASALIRVYAYVYEDRLVGDAKTAARLVPIAETRTDDSGIFQLLLPSVFE